jgi:hypothetical protein
MRSALYYPHTRIRNESLLKAALLLWDRLEFISPFSEYRPEYENRDFAEAIELIGRYRCPTEAEKREVHELIEDFATQPFLPPAFFYRPRQPETYEIYPQKFLPQTWDMLRQLQLTNRPEGDGRHDLAEATGLSMMSLLADCCAGETRTRVTDRGSAYANIPNLTLQAEQGTEKASYDAVVPLTLRLINTEDLSLATLVEFRKREEKSKGLEDLRHRYANTIERYIADIDRNGKESDILEHNRVFEENMKQDLEDLRSELGHAVTLMSLAFVTSILVASERLLDGPLTMPQTVIAGGLVAVGGVLGYSKLAANRKRVMQRHPMAYMYQLERFEA